MSAVTGGASKCQTTSPLSSNVELVSLHSDSSAAAFPSLYRRNEQLRSPTSKEFPSYAHEEGGGTKSSQDGMRPSGPAGYVDPSLDDPVYRAMMDRDRVEYKPIPEKRKLGYFSTASLIISKMIGTGVFAKPSVVLANSGGRGISLFLWVACGIMSLMGLLIYVEMGITMPFSGAEVIYVEECYQRPRYLAVIVVGILFVLLTHFAGNCIAFAKLVLQAFEPGDANPDYRLQKFVALCLLTFVCLLHTFSTKWGLAVNNLLAIYKVTLVTFIILVGFAAMGGARGKDVTWGDNEHYGLINFQNAMVTQPKSMLEYASAILGVLWAYTGWENANYVLSEVRRPRGRESSVFKVASFSAISIVTVLYVLANVAYFTVLTDEEMLEEGEMVAAKFFNKVFGEGWVVQRGLKVMVALSILGNFVSSTYGLARVKQEIAKMRILPFSKFFARQSHYNTPVGALVLHWIVAAAFILFTPSNKDDAAYNLITDLFIYGQNWMIILVTIGVLCLRYRQALPNARRVDPNVTIPPPPPGTTQWSPSVLPWRFLLLIIMIYVPLNLFIIILTWWPPVKQTSIPSYVTPGVATGIIVAGVGYWVVFAKIMPAVGYHIDSAPDELIDGSRIVTYKRYKTGWAKWASDTVAKWTTKEKD